MQPVPGHHGPHGCEAGFVRRRVDKAAMAVIRMIPSKLSSIVFACMALALWVGASGRQKKLPPTVQAPGPSAHAAPGVSFTDVTGDAGLAGFRHCSGTQSKDYLIESTGSGCAFLDYDNDGWLDIYLVNGATLDALRDKTKAPRAALYHNNHNGIFTDVTDKAGVANERWGQGVCIGDF